MHFIFLCVRKRGLLYSKDFAGYFIHISPHCMFYMLITFFHGYSCLCVLSLLHSRVVKMENMYTQVLKNSISALTTWCSPSKAVLPKQRFLRYEYNSAYVIGEEAKLGQDRKTKFTIWEMTAVGFTSSLTDSKGFGLSASTCCLLPWVMG